MRCLFALAPMFMLARLSATGQQETNAAGRAETEVVAPVLLPYTVEVSTPKHCEELDGIVKFAATIDAAGLPHELKPVNASDQRIVGLATEIVAAQRFKPATIDGSPTTVAVQLTVGLHTCAEREKHPKDGHFYRLMQRAHPLIALAIAGSPAAQEVMLARSNEIAETKQEGEKIGTPFPIVLVDPEIPVSGKLGKRGRCIVSVTIDTNGIPQNVHVFHGLEPELDSYALAAAKSWRFKPAHRSDGSPIAFEGTVVATFESVDKEPVAFANFISEPPNLTTNKRDDRLQNLTLEPVNADEVVARYMPQSCIAGHCLVSLVIDPKGVPQFVHVVKGLDSSLDLDTVAMVQHLRFKPVLADGTTPSYVGLVLPVRYRSPVEKPTWRGVFYALAEIPILALM